MTLLKVVKENDHRFLWHLVNTFGKLPDDNFYEEIDPFVRQWMYCSWMEDQKEKLDFARHHGILIGSFMNSEAAQSMLKEENPDYSSSDEDFEKTSQMILASRKEEAEVAPRKRKRRKVVQKD